MTGVAMGGNKNCDCIRGVEKCLNRESKSDFCPKPTPPFVLPPVFQN